MTKEEVFNYLKTRRIYFEPDCKGDSVQLTSLYTNEELKLLADKYTTPEFWIDVDDVDFSDIDDALQDEPKVFSYKPQFPYYTTVDE